MAFRSIVPMLYTQELPETIDFYVSLGFTCRERHNDWGWAALHRDGCELMLAKPNSHMPFDRPGFTGSFYIKVDDVDSVWDEIREKANVCYEPETFDWGMKEFAVYDNNGYVLQFGQETG